MDKDLGSPRVVVGVTGGIAAYKVATLVRLLVKAGIDVTVIPTPQSLSLVGRTTWEALTGHPALTEVTDDAAGVAHVRIGTHADLVILAPATANTLAKMRLGIADNLLTNTLLVAQCPVLVAPAMHTQMWENPATRDNVETLRGRGIHVMEPDSGRLTGEDSGKGRMPEPEDIAEQAFALLGMRSDLAGTRVAISAGGTREALDPVRFLGNRSSGRFGIEIAKKLLARGAEVRLVAANVETALLEQVRGARIERLSSTAQLHEAMDAAAREADVVIMSAAVADFRPKEVASSKQKKDGSASRILELVENPDILADLGHHRRRENQLIIGFAAETGDERGSVVDYGRRKAQRKGTDLTVVNEVGDATGFGDVSTAITVLDSHGQTVAQASGTKAQMANVIVDAVAERIYAAGGEGSARDYTR